MKDCRACAYCGIEPSDMNFVCGHPSAGLMGRYLHIVDNPRREGNFCGPDAVAFKPHPLRHEDGSLKARAMTATPPEPGDGAPLSDDARGADRGGPADAVALRVAEGRLAAADVFGAVIVEVSEARALRAEVARLRAVEAAAHDVADNFGHDHDHGLCRDDCTWQALHAALGSLDPTPQAEAPRASRATRSDARAQFDREA